MRSIRALIALAAVAAGIGAAWIELTSTIGSDKQATAAIALLVGWSYVASGLIAWRHRPTNPLGPVMLSTGFAWFATFLTDWNHAVPFTVGWVFQSLYLLGFAFLILSFPSGKLTGRSERILLVLTAALVIVVQIVWLLFAPSRQAAFCSRCPDNLLQIGGNIAVANDLLTAQRIGGITVSLLAAGLIVRRWRRASVAERRAAAPVLWSGTAILVGIAVSVTNDVLNEPLGIAPALVRALLFAAFPVAVLAVLLRQRLARSAVARLVVELGDQPRHHDLRQALARTLGDPTLELAFWVPAINRYVDADGTPIHLPDKPDRASTLVQRGEEPIAVLIHDPALTDNAELIDSVCAAAALALENERLQADLRSRLTELAASRARLVEASENERRRLERDLHDGAQQRLVSIAMALGLVDARMQSDPGAAKPVLAEARQELTVALEELRRLGHGIRPSILTERGLAAALDDLAQRSTLEVTLRLELGRRLPDHIESCAYFLVSESLANAGKHAHTREATVQARIDRDLLVVEVRDDGIGGAAFDRGTGLRGLTDRVEGLGGRLSVTSPPGRGTTVRAEIPCA